MKPGDLQNGPSVRILRALRDGPNDTVTLAAQLGLTRHQAKCALQYLHDEGRVVRLGVQRQPNTLGRSPVLWARADGAQAQLGKRLQDAATLLRKAGYTVLAPGERAEAPVMARTL